MEIKEIVDEIRTKPTVPIWPHAGMAIGSSRNATYDMVKRGEIDVVRVGRKIRAVSASLRRKLQLEETAAAQPGNPPMAA